MTRMCSYALFVAISLAVVGLSAAHALDTADLPKAIENAKTPADHEAIATYFDEQAKDALATAADHQRMGAIYKKRPPVSPKSGDTHAFHTQMGQHCDDLVKKYEQAAKDYEAMAASHRAEAKVVR